MPQLSPRQHEVMTLEVQGKTTYEIAATLKVTRQAIEKIKHHPNYLKHFNRVDMRQIVLPPLKEMKKLENIKQSVIREEIKRQLDPVIRVWKNGALPAAEQIVKLSIEAKEEALQFAASKEVVNQAGYVPEKKVTTMSVELTGNDAERITQAFTVSQTRTRDVGPDN